MHKVFVFAFNCEATTLLPHIVSSRLGDSNTVLLLSPAGSARDNMVAAKVGSFELLVNLLRERGLTLNSKTGKFICRALRKLLAR